MKYLVQNLCQCEGLKIGGKRYITKKRSKNVIENKKKPSDMRKGIFRMQNSTVVKLWITFPIKRTPFSIGMQIADKKAIHAIVKIG